LAASGGHQHQVIIGGELQHYLWIGLTQLGELIGGQAQPCAESGWQV
jgi:hypothetical protein